MRSKDPRLNIIGAVLTAAAVLLAIPGPAHADVKSVSNTAQGGSGSADLRFGAVAQPFTTGSDADGYTIRIVNVQLDTAPGSGQLTLQLWNSDSVSNNPGTRRLQLFGRR